MTDMQKLIPGMSSSYFAFLIRVYLAVRKQKSDLCHHMVSLGHIELNAFGLKIVTFLFKVVPD